MQFSFIKNHVFLGHKLEHFYSTFTFGQLLIHYDSTHIKNKFFDVTFAFAFEAHKVVHFERCLFFRIREQDTILMVATLACELTV